MATQEQIDSFYRFATERLTSSGRSKSVDELYGHWRYENLSPGEHTENVAAIQASIDDMNCGETGHIASEIERELRNELNLPE